MIWNCQQLLVPAPRFCMQAVKEVEALRQALELVEQERLALVEKYGPAVLAFVLKEGL